MSADKDQEYFSDGIAEELLNLLAKIPQLRVISRSSAFSFKGKDVEIPEIAEALNVAHMLEGSVRKAGNQVRITAQLIEARTDTHLWSETYDRPLDDIFAVQDEIAAAVVAQLKLKLLGAAPKAKDVDPEGLRAVPAGAPARAPEHAPRAMSNPSRCTSRRSRSIPTTRRRGTGWPRTTSTRPTMACARSRRATGWPARRWTRRSRSTRTSRRPTRGSAGSRWTTTGISRRRRATRARAGAGAHQHRHHRRRRRVWLEASVASTRRSRSMNT